MRLLLIALYKYPYLLTYLLTMFYDNVCLKDLHSQLIRVLVSKCDDWKIVTTRV